MPLEFVVFNKAGREIDWIDPVESYVQREDGSYDVDNGYAVYNVDIHEGERFVVRERMP